MVISIGKFSDDNKIAKIDLNRLIDTRLLVQANSGGGKSYLLRKLIEEIYGHAQIIILDIEGEFSTLREKFDFILAGKNADVVADPRMAGTLARKILELKADLICDLYELKQNERIAFVKNFLNEMINAPKELWHQAVIVLDEAHVFAPEKSNSESVGAVIDMATRGRKRGYCLIPATQRLSKLHKDVAAECGNKLIGRTGLDIDMKRAADELGFDRSTMLTLRDLEPGEFFAFGPAITKKVSKVQIGEVKTRHPQSGASRTKIRPPAPTAKVKAVLAKLKDLPKETERELHDKQEMLNRIKQLERELKMKSNQSVDPKNLEKIEKQAIENARREFSRKVTEFTKCLKTELGYFLNLKADQLLNDLKIRVVPFPSPLIKAARDTIQVAKPMAAPRIVRLPPSDGDVSFGKCERSILAVLFKKAGQSLSKVQISAVTHYSQSSSGFNNSISKLCSSGFVIRQTDGRLQFNDEMMGAIGNILDNSELSATSGSPEGWLQHLPQCERKIFQEVLNNPQELYFKTDLAEITGYSVESSGFNNALSKLNSLGLIQRQPDKNNMSQQRNHGGLMKSVINTTKVPIKIWSDLEEVEDKAIEQLKNTANLPFVFKHVAVMPDVHLGIGATVGSVIATKDAICPAAVGVDIGCGMMAIHTDLDHRIVQDKIKEIRHSIERSIPLGFSENTVIHPNIEAWSGWKTLENTDSSKTGRSFRDRAFRQLGSLGGGNHFIEICLDLANNVWVMLHSGSRGIGNLLARKHIDSARGLMKKFFIELPDPYLAFLPAHTSEFDVYIKDLNWCQEYALENREEMMRRILKDLSYAIFGENHKVAVMDKINCHHNYVAWENHFGENIMVTRKGAVRARKGDLGIIPGSMGTKSYIVRGLGNPLSFNSCSHGAGRRMSRTQAKKLFTIADLEKQTSGIECRKDESVIDEIPESYKDIDEVMENQKDLVEVVTQLKQIMCVKG